MPLLTLLAVAILGAVAGSAVFVLLWDRYRDKIRAWNIEHNLPTSTLSSAVVKIDGYVTGLRAKVRIRRKDRYYDEDVYEETLSDEQVEALKNDRPHLFKDGGRVSLEEELLASL